MKPINLETHYTAEELATITGLGYTRFYDYQEIMEMDKYLLPSKRVGYGVSFTEFENALERSRTYQFEIAEYERYRHKKRPINRQFLNAKETTEFLELMGIKQSIFTTRRKIREKELPAYSLNRKFIVPIIYLIRVYALPINKHLDASIAQVINESYRFKLD
ncbi:hypothetical protein J2T17_005007 [Paenibacillus mucilaginosus]|uniref:hypothetical protein n=1 Tax=Paenibacillus mucilaginosus TaxID=61624 RepID=UPI003D201DBE